MKILTTADILELDFMAQSDGITFEPKADKDSGEIKLSFDGKPLYSARGLQLLRKDDAGKVLGMESNAFVSIITPPKEPLDFGSRWRATGLVQVTHFVTGQGRLGVSLQVESLEQIA